MTSKEILHEIVVTEQKARALYADAVNKQERFEADIAQAKEAIHDKLFSQADSEINAYEEEKIAEANSQIEALDKQYDQLYEQRTAVFEKNRDALVDKLFSAVVNQDA